MSHENVPSSSTLTGVLHTNASDKKHLVAYMDHNLNTRVDHPEDLTIQATTKGPQHTSVSELHSWMSDSTWNLKNGISEHIPSDDKLIKERNEENNGTLFIGYFPISDFTSVLEEYKVNRHQLKAPLLKEKAKSSFKKARQFIEEKLTGRSKMTITITPGGIFFGEEKDPVEKAQHDYEWADWQLKSLRSRLAIAQTAGITHMILGSGLQLAEKAIDEESNSTELIILGNQEETEKIANDLGTDIPTVISVLTELFRPSSGNIDYKAYPGGRYQGWTATRPEYDLPPYTTGEYQPLGMIKRVKFYDYRSSANPTVLEETAK